MRLLLFFFLFSVAVADDSDLPSTIELSILNTTVFIPPTDPPPLQVAPSQPPVSNNDQSPLPWPFGGPNPLASVQPITFPTLPPINLGKLLQGVVGVVPTNPVVLPTLPPIDPNKIFEGWPTLGPLPTLGPWPTLGPFPTLGPWPTLPPLESLFNGFPTLGPLPTLGPWPTIPPLDLSSLLNPTSQQCIPKLLAAAKQDDTFGQQVNNFTISGDVGGAIQAGLQQAQSLCSQDQVTKLTNFISQHQDTWQLMSTYGKTLTVDERQKVKGYILDNNSLGVTLFGMQKGLENLFNPTVSAQLSQISSQLSLIQLQLFFTPI